MDTSDFYFVISILCTIFLVVFAFQSAIILLLLKKIGHNHVHRAQADINSLDQKDTKKNLKDYSNGKENRNNKRWSDKSPFCISFMDSNRKILNPRGLCNKFIKIVTCNTANVIPHKVNFIASSIEGPPEKVIISTGTNDYDEESENDVIESLKKGIAKVKSTWPNARIIISNFCIRREKDVKSINDLIKKLAEDNNAVLVEHKIEKEQLRKDDEKHVDKKFAKVYALEFKKAIAIRD